MSSSITVILNVYKRFHVFQEQLNAILSQTIKPIDIIVVNNNNNELRTNREQILKKNSNLLIIDISENMGVWPRFFLGFMGKGDYIAVFDDDTIPGEKWFENCMNEMNKEEGLYGTIGLLYNGKNYFDYVRPRPGWHAQNPKTVCVDLVGHAWFFKKTWISTMMNEIPNDIRNPIWLKSGEDIHLSYTLQKYKGINTFVPPHPPNNLSLFGSNPKTAWSYGTDKNALSVEPNSRNRFEVAFQHYMKNGFQLNKLK